MERSGPGASRRNRDCRSTSRLVAASGRRISDYPRWAFGRRLYVREYVSKYPAEIAGIVLVDATPPESFERIPSNRESVEARKQRHREAESAKVEHAIGVTRLKGDCKGYLPPQLRMYRTYEDAAACRPVYETSWLGEVDEFENSASEVKNVTFGDTPLLMISQDPDRPKPRWDAQSIAANPIFRHGAGDSSRREAATMCRGTGPK